MREFKDSDVLARFGVKEIGRTMEKGFLDPLHESHQATKVILRVAKGSITFPGIWKKIKARHETCKVCKKYGPSKLRKVQEVVPDGFHHWAPRES